MASNLANKRLWEDNLCTVCTTVFKTMEIAVEGLELAGVEPAVAERIC